MNVNRFVLSCFSRIQLFMTLWTVDHQAPLSMGFSRKEYWSELAACNLEVDSHQDWNMPVPWFWISSLQDWEREISLVYRLHSLWYFVTAA